MSGVCGNELALLSFGMLRINVMQIYVPLDQASCHGPDGTEFRALGLVGGDSVDEVIARVACAARCDDRLLIFIEDMFRKSYVAAPLTTVPI